MLKPLIGEAVELITALDQHLGRVRADAGQFVHVVMNLALNARDAMPDGGTLTIETANVEFTDEWIREHVPAAAGRYVMLALSDTGVGMDEQTKARVFEPFFTTKAPGAGTGLGLAMVYGTVKQSGGFIWVCSEPGQGTTFKIYLPRVEDPVAPHVSIPAPSQSRGTETILVVEDDAVVRAIARRALERRGYTVVEAADGQTAQRLTAKHTGPIHLLLADVVMPGMSGRHLAEQLKEGRPDLKVLYMSGYTDDVVMRRSLVECGAGYLQ